MYSKINKLYYRILSAYWMLLLLDMDRGRSMAKISFAQNGEDLIIWQALSACQIKEPFYLDIGAHHPRKLSNTMLFYLFGFRGMNIEPDPDLFAEFPKSRPEDLNLNVGVGEKETIARFYRMRDPLLNTFNAEEAQRLAQEENMELKSTLDIPVKTINQIFEQAPQKIDVLSLDTEGNDLTILKSLNFSLFRPTVICVETLTFSTRHQGTKLSEFDTLLETHNYQKYADTHINSIYVDTLSQ
ncbi:MAG: FkbM family methyltransferase [Verrucomicrobiota bacterium]